MNGYSNSDEFEILNFHKFRRSEIRSISETQEFKKFLIVSFKR